MNTDLYLDFIEKTVKSDGYEIADKTNKIALKENVITQPQYSKAAKIIAAEILKR